MFKEMDFMYAKKIRRYSQLDTITPFYIFTTKNRNLSGLIR